MNPKPILILAPMRVEMELYLTALQASAVQHAGGYAYHCGLLSGRPAVVAHTQIGMVNTALALKTALDRFTPACVISQGTCGAHDPALEIGDIIIGRRVYCSDAIQTGRSDSLDLSSWQPLPTQTVLPDGSVEERFYFDCTPALVDCARRLAGGGLDSNEESGHYDGGRVYIGSIATTNAWNRQRALIDWDRHTLDGLAEEMEGAAAAQVCALYDVPHIALRIVSNNELKAREACDFTAAYRLQRFIMELLPALPD